MQQALVGRGMSPRTQEAYRAAVKGMAQYYHQRPDTLSEEQLHASIRQLIEQRHVAPSSVRGAVRGLRFFSTPPCSGRWPVCPYPRGPRRCPWSSAVRR